MKTIIVIFVAVMFAASLTAQVPQKMSYQAIIRNENDSLVRNQPVGLRVSIIQGSVNGSEVYKEGFNPLPSTNINGLVTVEIGAGVPVLGKFSSIDWLSGPYFIKTEIDPNPGGYSNHSIVSTSQLLSVPYALHAKTAESIVGDVATKSDMDALQARIEAIEKHLNILPDSIFTDSVFTDARDGTQYKMVKIGNQTWMAENLKYLPDVKVVYKDLSNTEPQYFVNFDYNATNINDPKASTEYNIYGVLYNWPAVMNGAQESSSNPSGVQGVCPSGWHLPSYPEWEQLIDYLGGESVAGGKLKESGTTQWKSPNTGATNESGFTALPGGDANLGWGLTGVGYHSIWWSASWNNLHPTDYFPGLEFDSNMVHWGKYNACCNVQDYKSFALSVRCIKD